MTQNNVEKVMILYLYAISLSYILGGETTSGGETSSGDETTRGKRLGRKRLGGKTTRGGNGLGAKHPGFVQVGYPLSR